MDTPIVRLNFLSFEQIFYCYLESDAESSAAHNKQIAPGVSRPKSKLHATKQRSRDYFNPGFFNILPSYPAQKTLPDNAQL